jgi:hypothetical protein
MMESQLKDEFLAYLSEWERSVQDREGYSRGK